MKNQNLKSNLAAKPLHQCQPSPYLQLAAARAFRRIRIPLPKPARRQLCLADRAIRSFRESAELAVWQAQGGNTLRRFRLR